MKPPMDQRKLKVFEPAPIKRRGFMMVLSSPSGAGKTTITRKVMERDPTFTLSVSATTRARRPGEVHGRDYFFVTPGEFEAMVQEGEFLEHATVFGHRYGTPATPGAVRARRRQGRASSTSTGRVRSRWRRRRATTWSVSSCCRPR